MNDSLAKISIARKALAEARTLNDFLQIRDIAVAGQKYAQAAKLSMSVQNEAAEIARLAERGAGEWLKVNGPKPGDNIKKFHGDTSLPPELSELGITKLESHRWQQIASVPEDEFIRYLRNNRKNGKEITQSGLLKIAKKYSSSDSNEEVEEVEIIEWVGEFKVPGLYLANSTNLEIINSLPKDSIDMIFTDPPWDEKSLICYESVGRLAARVLKPGKYCMVYCGKMFLPEIMNILGSWLDYVWTYCVFQPDNNQSIISQGVPIFEAWRPIVLFRKPGDKYDIGYQPDAMKCTRNKNYHKWGQGQEPIEKYIQTFTRKGEIIFDPFIGGGVVPAMAKKYERIYLGFDKDENALKISIGRLNE